jgi:hypothetical protein
MFNRSLSGSLPTPKEKQQSYRMPSEDSTQPKQTRRHSITPATPDGLLLSLETIDVPRIGSPGESSVQSFLFGSTEEIEKASAASNQENRLAASQPKNDRTTAFGLATPLTDLENDIILFVCPTQFPFASTFSTSGY